MKTFIYKISIVLLMLVSLSACNSSDSVQTEPSTDDAVAVEVQAQDTAIVAEDVIVESSEPMVDEFYSKNLLFAGVGFLETYKERIVEISDEEIYKQVYRFFALSTHNNYPTYPVKVEDGKVYFYGGNIVEFVVIIVDVKQDKFYMCIRKRGGYSFYKDESELFFPEKLLEKTGLVTIDENSRLLVAKQNILDEMYGLGLIKFSRNRYNIEGLEPYTEVDKLKLFWSSKTHNTGYGAITATNTQFGFYKEQLVYVEFSIESGYSASQFFNYALENFGPYELTYEGESNSRSLYKFSGEKVTCVVTTYKDSDKVDVEFMETTMINEAAPFLLRKNQSNL